MRDCGAKLFITSRAKAGGPKSSRRTFPTSSSIRWTGVGTVRGFEAARAKMPDTPISDEAGRRHALFVRAPRGVRRHQIELKDEPIDAVNSLVQLAAGLFGFNDKTVYLSPAPLYHAAPLRWCMTTHRLGGR